MEALGVRGEASIGNVMRMVIVEKLARVCDTRTVTASGRISDWTLHHYQGLVLEEPAFRLLMGCEGRGLECWRRQVRDCEPSGAKKTPDDYRSQVNVWAKMMWDYEAPSRGRLQDARPMDAAEVGVVD